jgi:hypothetical protein
VLGDVVCAPKMASGRFVDSPLLEDDMEDLPEVPSRLDDYDDASLASTRQILEARFPDPDMMQDAAPDVAQSKSNSRKSSLGITGSEFWGIPFISMFLCLFRREEAPL